MHRIIRFAVASAFAGLLPVSAHAVIDPFTVPQGPFTVGPGEVISPEQGVIDAPGVLGGFRVMGPAMGDDAPAGSFTTVAAGAGQWQCLLDVGAPDPVTANGGCSVGWDRSEGPLFDFSMVDSFDIPVLEVSGAATVSLQVVDVNETLAISPVENVGTGLLQLPRSSFFALTGEAIQWDAIDNISLVVINRNGDDALVRIGTVGASGVIPGAQNPPPPPSDEELSETISGNFRGAVRSGEGCQLTREANGITFILTCYVYQDGDQLWMIGTGELIDGRIDIADMVITEGGEYGAAFDPDDVVRIPFGPASMSFTDCNNAAVSMTPTVEGFEPVFIPMRRIVQIDCSMGMPDPANAVRTGNWRGPDRSGEGFQLAVEGSDGLHVLTYYLYFEGRPIWLIGTGTIQGNRIVFADTVITSGSDFGGGFDADDVIRTPFGSLTMEFQDCNNATMLVEPILPEFGDLNLDLIRIVQGACN